MKGELLKAGDVFTVAYPFRRILYDIGDDEGGIRQVLSWKPGAEFAGENMFGRSVCDAHGEGQQVVTVVSVHQPGSFPTRVFFTRKWVDPDGATFGKNALKIKTADAFRRMVRSYAFQYRIVDPPTLESLKSEVQ